MPFVVGEIRETPDGPLTVEWRIDDFLKLADPSLHTSPPFRFANTSWCLNVHNVGDSTFRIFLGVAPGSPEVTVTGKLDLRQTDGTLFFLSRFTWTYSALQPLGNPVILSMSEIRRRKRAYLPSSALIVVCVLREPSPPLNSTLSSGLKNLLDSQKHCDVTIQVGEQQFKAHKVILAAGSEVFAAMLDRGTEETGPRVVTDTDSDPGSFKDFLDFLYTGRTDITSENVYHLYRTADRYRVGDLKSRCVAVMMQNMTVDNVCDVAALGDLCSDADLNLFCHIFFKENFRRVFLTSKWEVLMKDKPDVANTLLQCIASKKKGND